MKVKVTMQIADLITLLINKEYMVTVKNSDYVISLILDSGDIIRCNTDDLGMPVNYSYIGLLEGKNLLNYEEIKNLVEDLDDVND